MKYFQRRFIACSFLILIEKKCLMLCISIMLLFLYKYFLMLRIRLVGLNIYFYDVFFNYKKGSKKGYMEREENFCFEVVRK